MVHKGTTARPGAGRFQHRPDRLMIAMKGRGVETAVRLDRPAILAEFDHVFRHGAAPILAGWTNRPVRVLCERILTPFANASSLDCQPVAFVLFTIYIA